MYFLLEPKSANRHPDFERERIPDVRVALLDQRMKLSDTKTNKE